MLTNDVKEVQATLPSHLQIDFEKINNVTESERVATNRMLAECHARLNTGQNSWT